ncbi:hypothetical protein HW555_002961 [Spodoptera exigua]|uniref:Uncharacterized protein n=1 Tax=Spodoptera exigua TaxID=7107 RepID=A0A835L9T0_SPOEX|nr:hypothetical protein HW555_002961 [Spodoptera exigua]
MEVVKMPCSAVTLSIATITAIVAAALMAIAFSTDNWLYIEVKRTHIQVSFLYSFTNKLLCELLCQCVGKSVGQTHFRRDIERVTLSTESGY